MSGVSSEKFEPTAVHDLAFDATGRLVCVGEGRVDESVGRSCRAWCYTPAGEVSWVGEAWPTGSGTRRLVTPAGSQALVWCPRSHAVQPLDMETGRLGAPIGGPEPEGADSPHLDLCSARAVLASSDGSLLVLVGERLLRWDASGRSMRPWARWPFPWGLLTLGLASRWDDRPLYGSGSDDGFQEAEIDAEHCRGRSLLEVSAPISGLIRERPTTCGVKSIGMGHDGYLYVVGTSGSPWIARLDNDGECVYSVLLPFDSYRSAPCGDQRGNAYLRVETDDRVPSGGNGRR